MLSLWKKWHKTFDCRQWKNSYKKKNERAKKADDGEDDDLVLFLLMTDNKKENAKKKVRFVEDFKNPTEGVIICTIKGETILVHKEHVDWRLWCIVSHHEQQYQSF